MALSIPVARRFSWAGATAIGMSAGLATGPSAVGYEIDTANLVAMGAIAGAGIGIAQAIAMQGVGWRRLAWALVTPALWALGWPIAAQVIIDVDAQHANFGASGALVWAVLSGMVLAVRPAHRHSADAATRRAVG